jgi:hypothetical protein
MDVQGILAVRAFDRFHREGRGTGDALIPDCRIDLARFEVLCKNRLALREQTGG